MSSSHSRKRKGHSHNHHHHPTSHKKKKGSSGDALADAYEKLKKGETVGAGHAGHEMGGHESVREVDYNGHRIIIRTSYEIKVDGRPITGHVYVDNTGKVSTHALPAYSFTSTVDLVKKLIDMFPDNFGAKKKKRAKR